MNVISKLKISKLFKKSFIYEKLLFLYTLFLLYYFVTYLIKTNSRPWVRVLLFIWSAMFWYLVKIKNNKAYPWISRQTIINIIYFWLFNNSYGGEEIFTVCPNLAMFFCVSFWWPIFWNASLYMKYTVCKLNPDSEVWNAFNLC